MFDDEPHMLILHYNEYVNLQEYLNLYSDILTIVDTAGALLNNLVESNRSFVIVALLPAHISQQFQDFNQINFQSYTTIDHIYLMYREHLEFVTIKRNRRQEHLNEWRSTTNNILEKIIFVCSKTFDRNMEYCKQNALQSAKNGDGSIAALYEEQWLKRCRLQKAAMQQLFDLM